MNTAVLEDNQQMAFLNTQSDTVQHVRPGPVGSLASG